MKSAELLRSYLDSIDAAYAYCKSVQPTEMHNSTLTLFNVFINKAFKLVEKQIKLSSKLKFNFFTMDMVIEQMKHLDSLVIGLDAEQSVQFNTYFDKFIPIAIPNSVRDRCIGPRLQVVKTSPKSSRAA